MPLKCKKCGALLEKDANFCIVCGENNTPVEPQTEAPKTEQQSETNQTTQSATEPTTQTVEQPKTNPETEPTTTPVEQPETKPVEQPETEPTTTPVEQPKEDQNETNESVETDLVIPSDAEKDTTISNDEEENTSSLQQVPDLPNDDEKDGQNRIKLDIKKNLLAGRTIKRKKRKVNDAKLVYIIAGIGGSLFLLLLLTFMFAFYTSYKEVLQENPQTEGKNTLKVGTKEYGYVEIPKTWTRFANNSGRTLQYTDGAGWIITLFAVPSDQINAQTWSNTIAEQMHNIGAIDINVEQTQVDKYPGFKVNGFYNNAATYLSAWVMDGDDGFTHYIAIEGPNKFDENYKIVNTFKIE